MKKICALCFLLFGVISLSYGQWAFAFRAGIDVIPTSSNDRTHGGNLPKGFHAGIIGNLPVSSSLFFRPEVQYMWMNYYSHTTVPETEFINGIAESYQLPPEQARLLINSYTQKTETTTSYIFFPLLINYEQSSRFNFFLGPEIGFIFDNKDVNHLNAIVGGQAIEERTTINSTNGLRKTNIALTAGLELKMTKITAIEARYARSLNSLEDQHSNTSSYYNFIQLSFIYRLLSF